MSAILGVLGAALLGMTIILPYFHAQAREMQNVQAAATAREMKQVASAAQKYIQANYSAVEANASASSPATITIPMLVSTGYLPASSSSENPYGQTWDVQVLQPSAGNLQALVLSEGGQDISQKTAPSIASQTGQEGGYIPYNGQYGTLNDTVAEGAYGHWRVSMAGYSNPGKGHLAALLAFNDGTLQNDYLYRVKVPGKPQLNTMQTAINMGDNSLNNANDVNANGNIAAKGRIGADGKSPTSGYPSGWGGGIHTFDLYADGSVGVGKSGSLLSYMNGYNGNGQVVTNSPNGAAETHMNSNDGGATVYASNNAGAYSDMEVPADGSDNNARMETNGYLGVQNPRTGNMSFYAENDGYAGVSNTFKAGSRIELGTAFGHANKGWGCSPNGEIAADANGSGHLMACVNGKWASAGGSGAVQLNQVTYLGEMCNSGNGGSSQTWYNPYNHPVEAFIDTASFFSDGGIGLQDVCTQGGYCVQGGYDSSFASGYGQWKSFDALVPSNGRVTFYADKACGKMYIYH